MKVLNRSILLLFVFLMQICLAQSIQRQNWFIQEKEGEALTEISQRLKINLNVLRELNTHLKDQIAFKGDTVFFEIINSSTRDSIVANVNEVDQNRKQKQTENYKNITFKGKRYLIFEVDPKKHKIEFFNRLQNNDNLYSFKNISKNKDVVFVMNGGMYQEDYTPLGLYISAGKIYTPVNLKSEGKGNFYELPPNGIFLIDSNNVGNVITSQKYESLKTKIKLATQSGPMLVIDGKFNTNFNKGSDNVNIRNGVGINTKKNIVFAISLEPVNFYEFSELYRDVLKCKNALYLDGVISQCFIPELHKKPLLGPQLGIYIAVSNLNKSDDKVEKVKIDKTTNKGGK